MLTQAIAFVVEAIFDLFILSALVRFWMQVLRAPARNPLAQFTMALTDFAVKPLRRVVPGLFGLDWACLMVALLVELVVVTAVYWLDGFPFTLAGAKVWPVMLGLAAVRLLSLTV